MFTRLLFKWFFQRPTTEAPEPIFKQNTSNNAERARMCHSGLANKNLTFEPLIPKNRYFGPDYDGTKFSAENRFTMGMLHVNSPKSP